MACVHKYRAYVAHVGYVSTYAAYVAYDFNKMRTFALLGAALMTAANVEQTYGITQFRLQLCAACIFKKQLQKKVKNVAALTTISRNVSSK